MSIKDRFWQKSSLKLVIGSFIIVLVVILAIAASSGQPEGWIPQQQTFDGVEMVVVPSGCFMMGRSASDIKKLGDQHPRLSTFFSNQGPQTSICFDSPFWIDKYPVTNGQFKRLNGEADQESYWSGDNRPRESITWFEARDFCALRKGRLPTEAEWEYAARGQESLVYPWGNEWNPANAIWSRYYGDEYPKDQNRQTADVGSKLNGKSWVGALDMAGNVWEWTNSLYEPYPYNKDDGREDMESGELRTLRGGSWAYGDFYLQSSYRVEQYPTAAYNQVGFRCMRSFTLDLSEQN